MTGNLGKASEAQVGSVWGSSRWRRIGEWARCHLSGRKEETRERREGMEALRFLSIEVPSPSRIMNPGPERIF